jgi:septal ring factor EnvC (AmiA/AmiB activator)
MAPEKDEQFSLLITNLTQDQRAIIARQDKADILLATLVEQNKQHQTEMENLVKELKDLKKEQNATNADLIKTNERLNSFRWVGAIIGSILLVALGTFLDHFIH